MAKKQIFSPLRICFSFEKVNTPAKPKVAGCVQGKVFPVHASIDSEYPESLVRETLRPQNRRKEAERAE